MSPSSLPPLVVGFDLDMTLLDTRPGIKRVWEAFSATTGVVVDSDLAVSRLGPPLSVEMAEWAEPQRIDELIGTYRELYPNHAIEDSPMLPGARESLEAVPAAGGRVVVITAKYAANAQLHLDHLGLSVDVLAGDLWGVGKGRALAEHGATIYVGDHIHDVAGAKAAGALSVAVTTGPCSADDLLAAGADVVLTNLTEFPAWLERHLLEQRLAALDDRLQELGDVLVAFSGGADSAFLLAAAVRFLGPGHVAAATALSDSLPAGELEPARSFAASLGVRHLTPSTHELEREGYRANAGDRCYFCKAELVEVLIPLAAEHAIAHVATGTNADDALAGFRPGIRAARERHAVTPLLDVGMTKQQVRAASRLWNLPTWDKPAAACLSSRIAYGIEVTPHRLARVDRAEAGVRAALAAEGVEVEQLRVRDLGAAGRVELDARALDRVAGSDLLAAVLDVVRAAGFDEAVVDPAGFRSGSMNELLSEAASYR
ncbi:MAG: ATP-dependent sacrificial sulfur transferase LarE [Nocardioidaceae bacterium]